MSLSVYIVLEALGSTTARPGVATGTGVANDAVAQSDNTVALAVAATGTGTANSLSANVKASAGVATGTGTAYSSSSGGSNTDAGVGHEAEFVEVAITSAETGTGADEESSFGDAVASADTGSGTEAESVSETETTPGHSYVSSPRWYFIEPDTLESVAFEVNPSATNEPELAKNILYSNTLGPLAQSIIYQGNTDNQTFSWSGKILTEDQYYFFEEWWDRREPLQVQDDLGRVYTVYITEYSPKRERAVSHPWLHSYDMTALVLA